MSVHVVLLTASKSFGFFFRLPVQPRPLASITFFAALRFARLFRLLKLVWWRSDDVVN
jgi:hypothetical protein